MTFDESMEYKNKLSALTNNYMHLVGSRYPTQWSDAQVAQLLAKQGAMVRGRGIRSFVDFPPTEEHIDNLATYNSLQNKVRELGVRYGTYAETGKDEEVPELLSKFATELMEIGG